eukprot:8785052-Alexandrium_andersonii.AAC.1
MNVWHTQYALALAPHAACTVCDAHTAGMAAAVCTACSYCPRRTPPAPCAPQHALSAMQSQHMLRAPHPPRAPPA